MLDRPITPNEVEAVMESLALTKKKAQGQMVLAHSSTRLSMPILFKVFHKRETEGTMPKLF